MDGFVRLVGPSGALELFGVKLVGVTAANGKKLLFTIAFVVVLVLVGRGLRRLATSTLRSYDRTLFWTRQALGIGVAIVLLVGVVSIWFDDPMRLATALGLFTAGLAFALQKVVTAIAGYMVILRGSVFNVGDRITMGGVRGDVIGLSFIQTFIMEMGQPPAVESAAEPAMWVRSRQYTGRIVTVSNAKIFDEPVYNYTREFPFVWEELRVPIRYDADRARAERILLDAAGRHTVKLAELGEEALRELERRYFVERAQIRPQVYYRLTDDWLELTVRFIARDHGIRELKSAMSRDILRDLDAAAIAVASTTFDIVGLPALRVRTEPAKEPGGD